MAKFNDVLTIVNGKNQSAVQNPNGKYPIYGSGGIMGWADDYICEAETVIVGRKGSINNPIYVETPFWNVDTAFGLVAKRSVLLPKYLYYFCVFFDFEKLNTTVTIPSLTKANLLNIEIELPTIDEQQRIVEELDKIAHTISKHEELINVYDEMIKSRFIELFGDLEENTNGLTIETLDNLCKVSSSKRIMQNEWSESGVPFLRISDINNRIDKGEETNELYIPVETYNSLLDNGLVPESGDILITSRGTLGKCYIVKESDRFYFQDGMISWLSNIDKRITSTYLSMLFSMPFIQKQIEKMQAGSTVAYLSISMLRKIKIVVPSIEAQNEFIDFVEQTNKAKKAVQESLDNLEILKKSLMQKYFG